MCRLLAPLLFAAAGCTPCGGGGPCSIAGGRYFVAPPSSWDGQSALPTVVHVHAWNSSPQRWLNDEEVRADFDAAGLLLVLPEGIGESWNVQQNPDERDDVDFILDVLDDVEQRYPVDPQRIYASGHSVGAAVVHRLACEDTGRFTGFAPISGVFWIPMPTSCTNPEVALFHIHGRQDSTWPPEGRSFGSAGGQEAVEDSLQFWREQAACPEEPSERSQLEVGECEAYHCAAGRIQSCWHEGAHAAPDDWVQAHADWYARLAP